MEQNRAKVAGNGRWTKNSVLGVGDSGTMCSNDKLCVTRPHFNYMGATRSEVCKLVIWVFKNLTQHGAKQGKVPCTANNSGCNQPIALLGISIERSLVDLTEYKV